MRKLIITLVFLPLIALGHGGGDSHEILMADAGFEPKVLKITKGDTVVFKNTSAEKRWPASNLHPTHTLYPNSDIEDCGSEKEKQMFDACRGIAPGENYEFKFENSGEWKYHDHLKAKLGGTIIVKADGDSPTVQPGSKPGWFKFLASKIKLQLAKVYYKFFPSNIEKRLVSANMLEVAKKGHEEELKSLLQIAGAKKVMDDLLKDSNGGSTVDCHQEAHAVGRAAYEIYNAEVFADGDLGCHSGFYHGAMESFLKEHGTANIAKEISALCKKFKTSFGIFECLHGVGHGVMAYENYDLPAALATCKKLPTDWEKNSCYGAVFMENVVAGQGRGALEGHETEWVNKTDPHFPCNSIGDDYNMRYQCYQMQTSWMLWLNQYDFNKVIPLCLDAKDDMRSVCFKSLGRDAAGHTLRNPVQMRDICNKVPKIKDYFNQCIVGGVNVIVDFWGDRLASQGTSFCILLPAAQKQTCYQTLASRLLDVFASSAQRQIVCNYFEKDYQRLCSSL